MNDIQLYDYQEEMRGKIDTAFKSCQSVMVQMPTGTGKTYLLASVVYGEIEQSDKAHVWIVVHRRELVDQIEETLEKFGEMLNDKMDSEKTFPLLSRNIRIKVMSIQWLSQHYEELKELPSLIVVDEAHHAVAKTYAEVMNAYPEAKKLGVTATPCRLRKRGFTKLFDTLLMSWSTKRFIAAGRLSLYDYMSIKADSEDQRRILGLTQRGADGDFSLKEMSEKLDVKPSIERLCDTILRYAADQKGITYAIDIRHAEHIVEEYRQHGINAVAISSKTPKEERRRNIDRFKEGDIQVLVNVDLFGEGFDCPDVEFIQLARPTLSLAKYLQQVGRGLRVFEGKKYCLILDNVGLYRLFGLPSDDRDWQAMFEGKIAGKGDMNQEEQQYDAAYSVCNESVPITSDSQTELITVMTHDGQRMDLDAAYGYDVVSDENGQLGIVDKDGNEVLPCLYNKIELKAYGIVRLCSRRKIDRERPWMDLRNGVRFFKRPMIERHGFLEFTTTDGFRLYPRVRTQLLGEDCFVTKDSLKHGTEHGLRFKTFYIQPSEPDKLYQYKERLDYDQLWEDESGQLAWKEEFEPSLHPTSREEWDTRKKEHSEEIKKFTKDVHQYIWHFNHRITIEDVYGKPHLKDHQEIYIRKVLKSNGLYQIYCREISPYPWKSVGIYAKTFPQAYGIRVVQKANGKYAVLTKSFEPFETPEPEYDFAELQAHFIMHFIDKGREYWLYLKNNMCFSMQPEIISIGFLTFLKVGNAYVEMSTNNRHIYRKSEICMGNGICFLKNKEVLIASDYGYARYYIYRRYADGKRFILSDCEEPNEYAYQYDMYYDGENPPIVKKRKEKML